MVADFGSPIIPQNVENDPNISYATGLGILGTPVIDPATNIMYFVSGSQPASGAAQYSFNLNAIEIATGLPVSGSPVAIAATYSTPDLTTPLVFSAQTQNPRPALALANGNVYLAFASHNDIAPYNGWVLAYNSSTLAQTAVYSDTTTGTLGGIWNSGRRRRSTPPAISTFQPGMEVSARPRITWYRPATALSSYRPRCSCSTLHPI